MGLVLASCARTASDERDVRALSGSITISGAITDANGLPLSGVTVHLDGTSQAVQVETGGTYSFSGLRAGSYSVRPTLAGCAFVPDVANLNNLTTSRIQNFGGSGTSCGGTASVNTGATTGALTISGLVRDASGKPIVGARVNLSGAAQAIRFSDFTGGYVFHVDRGTYTLTASGACALTPASVNLNNIVASRTQNFNATNAGCITATASSPVASGEIITVVQGGAPLFTLTARVMTYADATQALASVQTISREQGGAPVRSLTIAGLPAIERQTVGVFAPDKDAAGAGQSVYELRTILTTAITAGSTVVRFGTQVPTSTDAATINRFFTTARNFTPEEIPALHGAPPPVTQAAPPNPSLHVQLPLQMFTSSVNVGAGELQMAATDAGAIVYGTNTAVYYSLDFGNTIKPSTIANAGGDPTVGVGAPDGAGHQNFYFGRLVSGSAVSRVEVLRSTDNGQSFGLTAAFPIDCKAVRPDGSTACDLPDQPQMAVDRRAKSMSGGGDRVYVAWRNGKGGASHIGISCSKDGGDSWSSADLTSVGGMDSTADWPRLVVGRDGFVYIMYQTFYALCLGDGSTGCGTTDSFCCSGSCQAGVCANRNPVNPQHSLRFTLWVEKLSSCDDGLLPQRPKPPSGTATFPIIVKDPVVPIWDMPGLDRDIIGNYMITGDDSDAAGQRLFLTFIEQTSQDSSLVINGVPALTSDDVRVAESTNAGLTWTVAPSPVNTTSVGHRFFPWICATNGIAYLTWYDRRSATLASTDLTSYFQASVSDPMSTGTLAFGKEVNVSGGQGFDDPQCRSGFPLLARSAVEETLCTDLPALPAPVIAGACSSGSQFCDFRAGTSACPSPQVCSPAPQGGVPKYGDYNGAACAAGNLFMAWTTAVPPKGQACTVVGGTCATASECCLGAKCVGSLCTDIGACTANGGTCTAANAGFCCSGNCLGGVCQPFVGVYASSTAVTPVQSCATLANAIVTFSDSFDIDTGLPPSTVGADYGQDMCPNQYLIEVNLTAAAFQGRNTLSVSGFWSSTVPGPGEPCELQATMSTFVFDGTSWQTWDVVSYVGMLSGGVCFPQALSHTNGGSVGLDVARIPLTSGFKKARIAVNAVLSGTTKKALAIAGLVN